MDPDQIRIEFFNNGFVNSHDGNAPPVTVVKVSGGPGNALAYVYTCFLDEDNDGAPNCYGLDSDQHCNTNPDGTPNCVNLFAPAPDSQRGLRPLERWRGQWAGLHNAAQGKVLVADQTIWAGLVARSPDDPDVTNNRLLLDTRDALRSSTGTYPVVKRDGPYAGYYVSTSWPPAIPGGKEWLQSTWTDAAAVPYAVWANQWQLSGSGVDLGDGGLVINNNTGLFSEFKFLDTGTANNLGECSRKLCRTLVHTPDDAIMVNNNDPMSFIVFPNSRSGPGVGAELAKLAAADNSDELILFLALGADVGLFQSWLRGFYDPPASPRVQLPKEYFTIMTALAHKGYPVAQMLSTGYPFRAVDRSVNMGWSMRDPPPEPRA
jgi:hypothetical protein